ncbi:hypothetical protein GLOIN_2v1774860 [Rhizophagus irregularis DAOM 181602=DAOM 197198]|nr:hypothetical protein GLOIN_2v1774860 [Rhizophagus irregularis DAOM 181602=DAOM 197198]
MLPTEEYNNTETFIKTYRPVLKELGVKNEFMSTELTNDVEHNDQNTKHQSENVIAESSTKNSKKSSTKLNAKAIPILQKEKDVLLCLQKWPPALQEFRCRQQP